MYKVYSMNGCASCVQATKLLESKGLAFEVVKIDEDFDAYEYLRGQGLRTMPQIFEDGVLVPGGFAGLKEKLK